MFDNIATKYDFLNRLLSAGIDQKWRKRATKKLSDIRPQQVLDIATGTGDLAFMIDKFHSPELIVGMDLSENMLEVARRKSKKLTKKENILFEWGDSENMKYEDNSFDAVTVAFGVRNFGDLDRGLAEIYRVLKPGGKLVVLEFSKPRIFGFKHLYNAYFKYMLPAIGKLTSKDPKAYKYLYESVQAFPDYEKFTKKLDQLGFTQNSYEALTLGICCIYEGIK